MEQLLYVEKPKVSVSYSIQLHLYGKWSETDESIAVLRALFDAVGTIIKAILPCLIFFIKLYNVCCKQYFWGNLGKGFLFLP